jgi:hypothetical protein
MEDIMMVSNSLSFENALSLMLEKVKSQFEELADIVGTSLNSPEGTETYTLLIVIIGDDHKTKKPWLERADLIKLEYTQNQEMKRKSHALNEQIKNLQLDLKLKDKALQEANVKIETMESRIENVRKNVRLCYRIYCLVRYDIKARR